MFTGTCLRFQGYIQHTQKCVFFRGARWVMDTSCPGSKSVCLRMMKFSTCPHSSNPLNILIITNLQTYSKGHTNVSSFLPPKKCYFHRLKTTAEMRLQWPDTCVDNEGYQDISYCLKHVTTQTLTV